MFDAAQLGVGLLLALAIALLAGRAGALSVSGMAAATLVGAVTFGLGGWIPAILLVTFFVSSSALSQMGSRRKRRLTEKFSKGSRRDFAQVMANGAIAAVSSALFGLGFGPIWLAAAAGALAAVTADTWGTELGVLADARPRKITDWSLAEVGTSGAVSLEGSLATVAGSVLLAGMAAMLSGQPALGLAAVIGGVMGAFVDSLLGASAQASFYCPQCDRQTERSPLHSCGTETVHVGGWRWLDNDVVNGLASLSGALTAVLLYRVAGL
jgi:uncharacterized protein (TIGR00297 family)